MRRARTSSPLAPLAALALALAGCAGPRAPAALREAGTLRLATWNLENLYDDVRQGDARGERVPAPAEVEAKLGRLAAVLRALDADVVAVQEVENAGVLARLGGRGYRAVVEEGRDPRGIDVGLLARAPAAAVAHRLGADRALFPRPVLEVRLETGGRPVVVLVAHLKSKVGGAPTDARRERQARRLRELADAAALRLPEAVVLVAGDLNDEPDGAPLAPLLADGAWVDVAAGLPAAAAWTYDYRGRKERIDYVLVARRDAGRVRRAFVPAQPGLDEASDHRPLVVELDLR